MGGGGGGVIRVGASSIIYGILLIYIDCSNVLVNSVRMKVQKYFML